MYNLLNTDSIMIAQKSLDALWLKQSVLSDNLANVDTPGYKSRTVEFEDILNQTLQTASGNRNRLQESLAKIEPHVVQNTATSSREDGNNVDVDEQNIELTRAQLQYQCMAQVLSQEINRMSYAIKGGA